MLAASVRAEQWPRRLTGTALDGWLGGLPLPGVTLLYGEPGAGKSSLAALLGSACSTPAAPGLYVSAEMTAGEAVATARDAGADLTRLVLWSGPSLAEVETWAEVHRPPVVVLDSVPRVLVPGADHGSERAQVAVLAAAVRMAQRGAAVVALHHATRSDGRAGPRGLEHDASAVLLMRREPHHRELVAVKLRGSAPGLRGGELPRPLRSVDGARPWAAVPAPPGRIPRRATRAHAEGKPGHDGVADDPAAIEADLALNMTEPPTLPHGADAGGEPRREPQGDQ